MEILYLWIEEYKNINRQGFNFNKKWNISFSIGEEENLEKGILKIEENKNYQNLKLFNKNILNITALIGENGTGKSSLLNFLKIILAEKSGRVPKIQTKYILIFKNSDNLKLFRNFKFKNDDAIKKRYEINKYHSYNGVDMDSINTNRDKNIEDIRTVFYSNIFDANPDEFENRKNDNLINLSINYLLREYFKNREKIKTKTQRVEDILEELNEKFKEDKKDLIINEEEKNRFSTEINYAYNYYLGNLDREVALISVYNLKEIFNCLNFIMNERGHKIFDYLNLPEEIHIDIGNSFSRDTYYYRKFKKIYDLFSEKVNGYFGESKKEKGKEEKRYFLKITLISKILYYIFDKIIKEIRDYDKKDEMIKKINNESLKYGEESKFLKKVIGGLHDEINEELKVKLDMINEIYTIMDNISSNIEEESMIITTGSYRYEVNIKEKIDKIKDLINLLIKLNENENYFNFLWRGLSSGEVTFLTMFARFYNCKNKITNDKTTLLLLDEPDIYLHPEWQRVFLKEFLNFINNFYKGDVQIIMTSHSPFFVSDLPRDNIIFLGKDDGKCKVINSEDKKQTFGANIHTLFSDSFFMDSTIGAFSKGEISKVIEDLSCYNKDKFLEEKEKISGIIDIIGEPIVKRKLRKMFNDKLKEFNDIDKIKLELEETKRELKSLKDRYEITRKK